MVNISKNINITDNNLCLIYSGPNGSLFEHDWETYWKIDDKYLYVKTYSHKTDIYFEILDGYHKTFSYEIHNILYEKIEIIRENIKNCQFEILEYDIKIKVVDNLPDGMDDSICISRNRNSKIGEILE